jgi:hypothetical protein
VENDGRFEVNERKDCRIRRVLVLWLTYRWHCALIPLNHSLHILLEAEAILVIPEEFAQK